MKSIKNILILSTLVGVTLLIAGTLSGDDLTSQSHRALQQLVAQNPAAAKAKSKAIAVLVFPDVVKAGFIFGAQHGRENGIGPSVVLVDKGTARSFTTDTLHGGIYAFTFDQQSLMAGLGLQGSKITRID